MGEASVRSGKDGEKIAQELLRLIGWGSLSCNLDIDCSFISRHKEKNKYKKAGKHGIDILYSYDDVLYHEKQNIIIGSVKHNEDGYPSSIKNDSKEHISELSTTIDCVRVSDEVRKLIGKSTYKSQYKGLLFMLSSSETEKNYNLIEKIDQDIDFGTNQFEEIYIIDNKKATFLVSCIKTAESYMRNSSIKFLYQNTGKNMDKSQLLISGDKLPIQLVNSEIIPIVKEESGKISCMIFCANQYSKENLSRLIWLSHKLCGLINEIRIYFPDYDVNKEYEVNGVKQSFKDESLTTKISIHRWTSFDFVSLKENQENNSVYNYSHSKDIELTHSDKISDDIEKILPYGDMLIPKLRTSILSELNLREFLFNRGIVTCKKSKEELLPIYSCLLLSPNELDNLKSIYKDKEDKPKEIERNAKANLGKKSLWETFNTDLVNLRDLGSISIGRNCTLKEITSIERVNSDYNHIMIRYTLEKENTTKDFLTGKTSHDGEIEITYQNNKIKFIDKHTSSETYKVNKSYFDKFSNALKKNNLIEEEFNSISFLDFENNKRIQFLLSFFDLRNSIAFKVNKMTLEDMRFRADESVNEMPQDLESLKGRVSNLNLHGKELDDTIYLSQTEYRDSILCEKMKFGISYNYMNRNGLCYLEFSFSGALGKTDYNDSELKISIVPSIYSYDNLFSSTKIKIVQEINRIKESKYEIYKRQ